jgi:hypothetical protein
MNVSPFLNFLCIVPFFDPSHFSLRSLVRALIFSARLLRSSSESRDLMAEVRRPGPLGLPDVCEGLRVSFGSKLNLQSEQIMTKEMIKCGLINADSGKKHCSNTANSKVKHLFFLSIFKLLDQRKAEGNAEILVLLTAKVTSRF